MANICIRTINYVTSGKYSKYFDLDIGYTPEDYNVIELVKEDEHSIRLGEGDVQIQLHSSYDDYYFQKFIENKYIQNATYVASIELNPNSSIDSKDNKSNLYSIFSTGETIIHSLYDIHDICIRSNVKDANGNHIEMYAPTFKNNLLGIVQNDNFTYCLTERLNTTPAYQYTSLIDSRNVDANEIRNAEYTQFLSSTAIKTYNYTGKIDSDNISSNYDVGRIVNGISFNYVFELQNNLHYNDYEAGDIYGDVYVGKNAYDSLYSTVMSDQNSFQQCRNYVGLGICGDNLYLKYTDDVNYAGQSEDMHLDVKEVKTVPNQYAYQKIETVKSVNRYSNNATHRTNMYSLRIESTGLNALTGKLAKLRQQIQMDIDNNIGEIVKNICPVHTQLLKVEYID